VKVSTIKAKRILWIAWIFLTACVKGSSHF
jgi:hypothetical protein